MNIKLSKNGIEELNYMIENNKRSFPTYECPYEKNNCYFIGFSYDDEFIKDTRSIG